MDKESMMKIYYSTVFSITSIIVS